MLKTLSMSIGLTWFAVTVGATSDRWATTYHVGWCPQGEQLMAMPVRFITNYASPETEIGAISKANHLDHRANSTTRNANLVSLYGIEVAVVEHSAARGTAVLIDLSNMTAPSHSGSDPSITKSLVAHTVECIILTAKHVVSGQLTIRIKGPPEDVNTDWQRLERTINIGETPGEM